MIFDRFNSDLFFYLVWTHKIKSNNLIFIVPHKIQLMHELSGLSFL